MFCSSLWNLIRENLEPAELAANDFGKRSAGSEDSSHVVREGTETLSPCHTFSDVRGSVSNTLEAGCVYGWHFPQESLFTKVIDRDLEVQQTESCCICTGYAKK